MAHYKEPCIISLHFPKLLITRQALNSFRIERTATKCIDLKNRLYTCSFYCLNIIFMEGEAALLSYWEIEKSIFSDIY